MSRVLYNGGVDIMNAGVIPLWNTATYYLVEPTVVLALEVFSLIFMKQHWEGLMTEADFPYNGLDCLANQEAMAWCGRYGYYKAKLEEPARAAIFVNESESFARRMLQQVPDDRVFTFGLATARRLSEQGGGGFSAPAFPTDVLTEALGELTIFFTTMVPSLLDVAFGVMGDIIQTSFSILMDAFFMVLKSIFFVLKMLVSKTYAARTIYSQHSGKTGRKRVPLPVRREWNDHHGGHAWSRLLYYLPNRDRATHALCGNRHAHVPHRLLQAEWVGRPTRVSNKPNHLIMMHACLLNPLPTRCVEHTCFQGPDAAADVATFFSMNIIIGRFAAIMDATMNSRSGKRFFKAPKTGSVSSKGRTRNPETGEVLDNQETDSASMGNPMYEFDFASAWDDFSGTTSADECSKCFTCKVTSLKDSNQPTLYALYEAPTQTRCRSYASCGGSSPRLRVSYRSKTSTRTRATSRTTARQTEASISMRAAPGAPSSSPFHSGKRGGTTRAWRR